MRKIKSFNLLSGIEEEKLWEISVRICSNGTFNAKGHISLHHNHKEIFKRWSNRVQKGYRGKYKNKIVMYKNPLPEGKVRHHEYYNDKDFDDGVVFITKAEHRNVHADESGKD